MSGASGIRLVLVKRRTRLEELVARYNTVRQAQFVIESMGEDFSDYLREDEAYRKALSRTQQSLGELGIVQLLDRAHVPNYLFGPSDTVVALGQDGLVAGTLKYLDGQPLIGVNPDPMRWDGVLLPFRVGDLPKIVPETAAGRRRVREVTMAKAALNDGQSLYAVNDFYIGRRTHVSARYRIASGGKAEQQSSSGIIVSTGVGSTGWLKSVLAGASGIARRAGFVGAGETIVPGSGRHDGKTDADAERLEWESDWLRFTVREPFPSRTTGTELVYGRIESGQALEVVSQMPEGGVIFSDGVEEDYLAFRSGLRATIGVAEKKGRLVV
ncbi:diacylglycerol kinase catalytic domain-containing protein [Cohnella rhizosphaerae]|uniref:Sugar kinase n=1 Tax=Cohnella rhizosphaerae TaxID=1457232 RepID=A0A9X4KYU3_9BACL|nr:sugar kinase [Cohnella rhizosphaerae]MDG0813422.1 sugar kinase [Cohnella rhizosphaerae]